MVANVLPPRVSLSPLDVAVIALFLGGILALGFSAKLRDNSVLQYLAAGRKLTLPMFVATLVSTWYGGILGISESVEAFGVGAWLLIGVPYYVFGAVYALFFAGKVREGAQISLPERLHAKFGRTSALAGAALLLLLAVPAAHVLMLGLLVSTLTGWDTATSVIVATLVGTLFLYRGGLLADVRVSMLAFVSMYVGFAVMLAWCLTHYPPLQTWRQAFQPEQLTLTGGVGAIQIGSFFILGAWTLVDPGFHQRAASAESPAIARKGLWVCIGFWFLFDMLSISTALYAVSLNQFLPPSSGLFAFPELAQHVLPPGLKALFLCGMIGTIMSAMVGYALVSGATIGREIYGRLWNVPDGDRVTLWTRIGIGVSCALAVAVGLSVNSVVNLWYSWGGAVVGGMLLPVGLSYGLFPKWRVSGASVSTATILGSGVGLSLMLFGLRTDNPYITVHIGEREGGWTVDVGTLLPGLAVSALILGIGAFLVIIRGCHHGRE